MPGVPDPARSSRERARPDAPGPRGARTARIVKGQGVSSSANPPARAAARTVLKPLPVPRPPPRQASTLKADRMRAARGGSGPSESVPNAPTADVPDGALKPGGPSARPDALSGKAGPAATPRAGSTPGQLGPQAELVLRHLESLPTLSPVAARLLRLSSAADADFDEIIGLIEADPALSARLLSLCRRAGTGVAHSVTTVRRAVVLLGLEAVQATVLSVQIYEMLGQDPRSSERRDEPVEAGAEHRSPASDAGHPSRFDRVGFWLHSIAVAACAELLADAHRELRVRPEEAFVAGLVHDLGKLALDWVLPRTYAQVIRLSAARSWPIARAERQVIGLDHHLAGKRLAEHWGLPHFIGDSMWLHGQLPAALPDVPHRALLGLVSAADAFCRRLHLGWTGSHDQMPELEEVCRTHGVRPQAVEEILPRVHESVARRARDLGLSDDEGSRLVVRSIMAANQRLAALHAACDQRARLSRAQGHVLEAITEFVSAARPGERLDDVLRRIGESSRRLTGVLVPSTGGGYLAAIVQARPGDPWRLLRLDAPATSAAVTVDPPRGPDGTPMELSDIGRDHSLGASVGLLSLLADRLPSLGGGAESDVPDLRTLGMLPLPIAAGPAVVLIHQGESLGRLLGDRVFGPLAMVWGSAVMAAAQHDGARRLAEGLAETSAMLARTQAQLAEARSMARLGELTAGAAHEFNNPLTVIAGRAQLLLERLVDPADRAEVQTIARAALRLSELVTRLHMIARPPEPKPVPCDVHGLLDVCARRARDASQGSAVELEIEVSSPLPPGQLDQELAGRVLDELLANAVRATGVSSVRLRALAEPDEESNDVLRLIVEDDGQGLSPEMLAHAFDPFYSHQPAGRRAGLGLPLARSLVRAMGGDLILESPAGIGAAGRGTRATVTLRQWRYPQVSHRVEAGRPGVASGGDGVTGQVRRGESSPIGRAA